MVQRGREGDKRLLTMHVRTIKKICTCVLCRRKSCEHDCSEHSELPITLYLPSSQLEDLQCGGEDETIRNEPEEEYCEDNDEELDRPKKDEELEQYEDERHESHNVAAEGDKFLHVE